MTRTKTTGGARQALTTLMVLALTGCIGAEIEHSTIWLEEFTLTETGGTRPTLAVDQRDGTVYVVWIGTDDGTSNLYLSRLDPGSEDRKSTRLNSSHVATSYAVVCLIKKNASPVA